MVIFTSIDTHSVIPVLPREAPLSATPIYVAFNQSGKGHYDAIVSQIRWAAGVKHERQSIKTSCRCGRGINKETDFRLQFSMQMLSKNTRLQRNLRMEKDWLSNPK